jgi:hypothetical protein
MKSSINNLNNLSLIKLISKFFKRKKLGPYETWQMSFNYDKLKVMHFGK